MKTSATNRKIRVLLTSITNGTLLPRPDFQRRLVWSNKHKNSFIETVLMGFPFPEIYIAAGEVDPDTGEGNEMLVDGQQRIMTLYQYFKGSQDLKLLPTIIPYSKLKEPEKLDFLEYEVVVRDLGKSSLGNILEVFRRINLTNYALTAMEIHNARYDGEFKQFGENLAQDEFFDNHRIFTSNEIRRMEDVKFTLTFIIMILSTYFNRDVELEAYLERYNEKFEGKEKLYTEIKTVFDFIDACKFNSNSRVWKKADLLTLLVELYRAIIKEKLRLIPANIAILLNEFYSKVNAVGLGKHVETDLNALSYYKAALQANNDRTNRITRGEKIAAIINKSLTFRSLFI
jgi:uncharacterized protein with ParB-like and HNH nuclease domain